MRELNRSDVYLRDKVFPTVFLHNSNKYLNRYHELDAWSKSNIFKIKRNINKTYSKSNKDEEFKRQPNTSKKKNNGKFPNQHWKRNILPVRIQFSVTHMFRRCFCATETQWTNDIEQSKVKAVLKQKENSYAVQ